MKLPMPRPESPRPAGLRRSASSARVGSAGSWSPIRPVSPRLDGGKVEPRQHLFLHQPDDERGRGRRDLVPEASVRKSFCAPHAVKMESFPAGRRASHVTAHLSPGGLVPEPMAYTPATPGLQFHRRRTDVTHRKQPVGGRNVERYLEWYDAQLGRSPSKPDNHPTMDRPSTAWARDASPRRASSPSPRREPSIDGYLSQAEMRGWPRARPAGDRTGQGTEHRDVFRKHQLAFGHAADIGRRAPREVRGAAERFEKHLPETGERISRARDRLGWLEGRKFAPDTPRGQQLSRASLEA